MLSAREQRQLDEIEQHLEVTDPALAAKLSDVKGGRIWPAVTVWAGVGCTLPLLVPAIGWAVGAVVIAAYGIVSAWLWHRLR